MIKNIIIDWSGVIRNEIPRRLFIINSIFKEYNLKSINIEELRKEWEKPPILFYKKYITKKSLTKEEIRKKYNAIDKKAKKLFPPQPVKGMSRLLKKLKNRGFNLFVITGDHEEDVIKDLNYFKFGYLFKNIFCSIEKMSEDLEKIILKNKINPLESIIVADNEEEINFSKKLGMMTIGITWGMQNKKRIKLVNPNFIANNLIELESTLICFLNN